MKHIYFIIFLLTLELFTTKCKGLPIGYTRGCNRRNLKIREKKMIKTMKTLWKPDKPEKLSNIKCDCPDMEHGKPVKNVACPPEEDDPEKWFMKFYQVPDTRPQKYILFSVNSDGEELKTNYKTTDVNREFKRCTLRCVDNWIILRCTPRKKICPRVSKKNCDLVFRTKFLQMNEPDKPKSSILSGMVQRKGREK